MKHYRQWRPKTKCRKADAPAISVPPYVILWLKENLLQCPVKTKEKRCLEIS